MEGAKRLRHQLPSVVRSFVPNRLAEELETSAYERLLASGFRGGSTGLLTSDVDETANDVIREFGEEAEELITTGGRS
jgi:hypothetical protein